MTHLSPSPLPQTWHCSSMTHLSPSPLPQTWHCSSMTHLSPSPPLKHDTAAVWLICPLLPPLLKQHDSFAPPPPQHDTAAVWLTCPPPPNMTLQQHDSFAPPPKKKHPTTWHCNSMTFASLPPPPRIRHLVLTHCDTLPGLTHLLQVLLHDDSRRFRSGLRKPVAVQGKWLSQQTHSFPLPVPNLPHKFTPPSRPPSEATDRVIISIFSCLVRSLGLKENAELSVLPSTGHETNTAQPKTDKWLSSPSHSSSFFTV